MLVWFIVSASTASMENCVDNSWVRKVTFGCAKSRKMTASLCDEQRIKSVDKKRVKKNLNMFRLTNDLSQFNQNIIIKMKTGSTIEQMEYLAIYFV